MAWYIKLNYWGYPQICAICQGLFSIPSTSDVILYILQFTTSSSTALILFVTFLIHSMKSSSEHNSLKRCCCGEESTQLFLFIDTRIQSFLPQNARNRQINEEEEKNACFSILLYVLLLNYITKLQQNIKNPRIAHEFFVCLL